MKKNIREVVFKNKRKDSPFDLLSLNDIIQNENLDHILTDYQVNDFYTLIVFTDGSGQHTIDFTDYPIARGTILSIRKGQIHKFFKSNAQGYVLLLLDDFFISYFDKSEVLKTMQLFNELISSPIVQMSEDEFQKICYMIDEIHQEYFSVNDELTMGIVRSSVQIILNKVFRFKSKNCKAFQEKKYLKDFTTFQELVESQCFLTKTVADYADQMCVTPRTLNNITTTIINKSAKQFIDEVVTVQIKRLLLHSDQSVKEIAFQAGFEESTNLYKFFKKHAGLTPEAFRNMCS